MVSVMTHRQAHDADHRRRHHGYPDMGNDRRLVLRPTVESSRLQGCAGGVAAPPAPDRSSVWCSHDRSELCRRRRNPLESAPDYGSWRDPSAHFCGCDCVRRRILARARVVRTQSPRIATARANNSAGEAGSSPRAAGLCRRRNNPHSRASRRGNPARTRAAVWDSICPRHRSPERRTSCGVSGRPIVSAGCWPTCSPFGFPAGPVSTNSTPSRSRKSANLRPAVLTPPPPRPRSRLERTPT